MDKISKFFGTYSKGDGYQHFFCPGRVNLIGGHIDYNGGRVFPCALEFGIYGAGKLIGEEKLILRSINMNSDIQVDLDDLEYNANHGWANYPKGIAKEFMDRGYQLKGMEIVYYGNIPVGAGLSSSAAIEILTCIIIDSLCNLGLDKLEWVKLSQKVENQYIGVNCGIMDQFAVCMGKKDHAILLDCDTLEYKYSQLKMDKHSLVIINSNKKRELASSKYNERRTECQEGLNIIQKYKDINNLCELNILELEKYIDRIEKENVRKRVIHAVTENERVINSIKALEKGDLYLFGKLMNESHDSLRDYYEVTGYELDTLVEEARKCEGVLGSRMTGGGFGGCTITLIERDKIQDFEKRVKEKYREKTGLNADFYYSTIGDGVKIL
ncbi:MAG: galactokinase [Tissierellia bacterium]|nr:galactokinase [Tissierellia bacterium]